MNFLKKHNLNTCAMNKRARIFLSGLAAFLLLSSACIFLYTNEQKEAAVALVRFSFLLALPLTYVAF